MTLPSILLVLIGGPGAGKGTVARSLRRRGWNHLSTGDYFRSEVAAVSPLGQAIRSTVEGGELLPDDLVMDVVERFLLSQDGRPVVLDGFPRSLVQSQWLANFTSGLPVRAVHLQASSELLLQRATRRRVCPSCKRSYGSSTQLTRAGICNDCGEQLTQRADDSAEIVGRRLAAAQSWLPVVNRFYRGSASGLLEVPVAGASSTQIARTVFDHISNAA